MTFITHFASLKKRFQRHPLFFLVLLVLLVKIFIFVVAYWGTKVMSINVPEYFIVYHFLPDPRLVHPSMISSIGDLLLPSDAQIYLNIATNWYTNNFFLIWFPLYPFCIWLINLLLNNIVMSSLLISNLASSVAFILFYYLIKKQFNSKIALNALLLYLFFPYALFFTTGHTESLFLLLILLTFYFLEKKQYFWASIFGMLVTLTRANGLIIFFVVALAILLDIIKKKKNNFKEISKKIFCLFIIPLGTFGYSVFNYLKTGSFFYWIESRTKTASGTYPSINNFLHLDLALNRLGSITFRYMEVAVLILFLLFLLISWFWVRKNKFPLYYWLYSLLVFLMPLLVNNFPSYGRYQLVSFPFFIFLAIILNNKYLLWLILLGFLGLQIYFIIHMVNWYFIA